MKKKKKKASRSQKGEEGIFRKLDGVRGGGTQKRFAATTLARGVAGNEREKTSQVWEGGGGLLYQAGEEERLPVGAGRTGRLKTDKFVPTGTGTR